MFHKVYQTTKLPALLSQIPDAPKKLYYKGDWEGIFPAKGGSASDRENCLAVVGARKMTGYGRRATEQIVGEIAAAGITIVSGFMYGVDAAAHKAAMDAGGRTIAVMPCGINRIHPEYQKDLYNRILDTGGLIISEYEDDMQPQNWTYPQRNRIVSGLSRGVLVVEADLRSGSLITANCATKHNRTIFAVPGPITSPVSRGTLKLIKEGAVPVTEAKDVLDFYKMSERSIDYGLQQSGESQEVDASGSTKESLEGRILRELQSEAQAADTLARELTVGIAELGTALSVLELRGAITREGEEYYINS